MDMKEKIEAIGKNCDRRDFLKTSLTTGLGLAAGGLAVSGCAGLRQFVPAPAELLRTTPIETVRVGIVGVGRMGSNHVRNLLAIEGVQLKAVCDIVPEKIRRFLYITSLILSALISCFLVVTGLSHPKDIRYER